MSEKSRYYVLKNGFSEEGDVPELPDDRITKILRTAHEALAAELVDTIKKCDAEFFERLVVKLLLKMGYGGSRQEAGEAVGRSGDGGIDGIMLAICIRERWPDIQIIITSGRPWPAETKLPNDMVFFSKPYRQDRVLETVRKMAA